MNESNAYYIFISPSLFLLRQLWTFYLTGFKKRKKRCNNPTFCCVKGNVLILTELCQYSLTTVVVVMYNS